MNFSQRCALITGATHGIGNALCKKLLGIGWHVFGTGQNLNALNELEMKFANFNGIKADLTNNGDIEAITSRLKAEGTQLHRWKQRD